MRIFHPTSQSGEVQANGLTFADGVAETDVDLSDVRHIFEEHGFRFEETPEVKLTAEEKKAAKAEAERLAGLPIHTGDAVKLSPGGVADGVLAGGDAEALEAWRGTATAVRAEDGVDVADIEDGSQAIPLDRIELVAE